MDEANVNVASLFSVEGKRAIVTGGTRGIGRMIAHALVANGARVCVSSRNADACEETARALGEVGECVAVQADLSTDEGREALLEHASAESDALDILVNNAGAAWGAPFEEHPDDGYDKVMDLNVRALFILTRDCLPLLSAAGSPADPARVINIGSIDGMRVPEYDNAAYGAAKAAVHHLTRTLAVRLKGKNITVNAIAPGPFESRMTKVLLQHNRNAIERACPLGRIGDPLDIAGAALFLASRAGAYVNGAVIPLDGGLGLA